MKTRSFPAQALLQSGHVLETDYMHRQQAHSETGSHYLTSKQDANLSKTQVENMTEWTQAQLSVHTIPPRKDLEGGHLPR